MIAKVDFDGTIHSLQDDFVESGIDVHLQDRVFDDVVFKANRVACFGIKNFKQERVASDFGFSTNFTHENQKWKLILRGIDPGPFGQVAAPENFTRLFIDAD